MLVSLVVVDTVLLVRGLYGTNVKLTWSSCWALCRTSMVETLRNRVSVLNVSKTATSDMAEDTEPSMTHLHTFLMGWFVRVGGS